MIHFNCPDCRTNLTMPDASGGKKTPCTTCGCEVSVPYPPGREPPRDEGDREPPRRSSRRRRRDDDYDDDYDDREPRSRFRCPYCRSDERPIVRNEISETGWILMIALLIAFFPLFWIGLLMKENVRYCAECGAKLGKCL